MPEERALISKLTVSENLRLGIGDPERALELFPELRPLLSRKACRSPAASSACCCSAVPLPRASRLLIADEMSLGLAPIIVRRLLAAIRDAADAGAGVLLVEQHARQALAVADRAYVLRRGSVVGAERRKKPEPRSDISRVCTWTSNSPGKHRRATRTGSAVQQVISERTSRWISR